MTVCWSKWWWCCYQATAEPPCKSLNRQAWMKMGTNLPLSCLHSFSTVVLCFFFKHSHQGHSGLKSTVYKSSFHNEQILALQKRTISFTHPLALSHVLSLLWRTLETAGKRRWGNWKIRLCHQDSHEKCDDIKKTRWCQLQKTTGCPRKKYLSEILGSQIHVTITGQPNKQNCMEWSNSPQLPKLSNWPNTE